MPRCSGKERDAESGLDYFGARYFSGPQGRFTSPDQPLLDQTSNDPQSWNLYSYARNNPLLYTDPTGRSVFPAINIPIEQLWQKLEEIKKSFAGLVRSYMEPKTEQTQQERAAEPPNPLGLPSGEQFAQQQLRNEAVACGVFSEVLAIIDPIGNTAIVKEYMTGDTEDVAIAAAGALLRVRSALVKPFPTRLNRAGKLQPYNPSNGRWLSYSANPGPQWTAWARFLAGTVGGYAEAKGGVGTTPVGAAGRAGQRIGWIIGQLPWF